MGRDIVNVVYNKRKAFNKITIGEERYLDILENDVFSTLRFRNNIKETAQILELEEKVVYSVITKMIIYVGKILIRLHMFKVRISIYGFFYFDLINPWFNPDSKEFYKNKKSKNK